MKTRIYVFAGLIGLSYGITSSQAEGFIAGVLRNAGVINEEQRRILDGAHAAMGNPLDHAANAAVNAYVPGAGTALEANRMYNQYRNAAPAPQYVPAPVPAQPYNQPLPQPFYSSAPQPQQYMAQPMMGGCPNGTVFMATPGGACCTPDYSVCQNMSTGGITHAPRRGW